MTNPWSGRPYQGAAPGDAKQLANGREVGHIGERCDRDKANSILPHEAAARDFGGHGDVFWGR
jgi:hypothetical protein